MKEEWKDIQGYEGLYQVSNLGNIKSLSNKSNHKRAKYLIQNKNKGGYKKVYLYKNHKRECYSVHRLVAKMFIPNPMNKKEVNHIDCNKENNCVNNLEWCTRKENHLHKCLNGLNSTKEAVEKNEKPIILINNNTRYRSMMDACRQLGLSVANVSRVCSGKLAHTKGYVFRLESEMK